MASFKLHVARLEGCPPAAEVAEMMEEYGLPEGDEFGVLHSTSARDACYGEIIRRTHQAVQKLDPRTQGVLTTAVEKVTVYPVGIFPQRGILEVYDAPLGGVEQVAAFLAGGLALPTVVTLLEVDVPSAIDKLATSTERFQLRSLRVKDYAHNSYMNGPYAPKFLDSEHGKEFLEEYADHVSSANVRFAGPGGRVTVTLSPKASFSYSLLEEDDKPAVQAILRKLL
jgi:hypothetical protein